MTKAINPFREAIPYLLPPLNVARAPEPRQSRYICQAIYDAAVANNWEGNTYRQARRYVEGQLVGCHTVDQWAMLNIPGFKGALGGRHISMAPHLWNELQAYRHRWLAHLADQYEQGHIEFAFC